MELAQNGQFEDSEGKVRGRVRICFADEKSTGDNRVITQSALESLIKSLPTIPVVGSFDENKNLIPTAEMALKYAKRNKQHIVLYSKDLGIEKVYEENILWARKITDALKENRVVPYFQPILNLQNNKIEKYLLSIDKKYGTKWCPTGIQRML